MAKTTKTNGNGHKDYPDHAWARDVCKAAHGRACCRYLTLAAEGWSCEKSNSRLKLIFDARAATGASVARGDNCTGKDAR